MKHFMLFFREDLEAAKQLTEQQIQEDIERMVEWVESLSKSGNFVSGEPLENEIRMVNKETVISDGPYIETKEAVTGYMIISATNIDQATQIAQGCPLLSFNIKQVEVRPILKF